MILPVDGLGTTARTKMPDLFMLSVASANEPLETPPATDTDFELVFAASWHGRQSLTSDASMHSIIAS